MNEKQHFSQKEKKNIENQDQELYKFSLQLQKDSSIKNKRCKFI